MPGSTPQIKVPRCLTAATVACAAASGAKHSSATAAVAAMRNPRQRIRSFKHWRIASSPDQALKRLPYAVDLAFALVDRQQFIQIAPLTDAEHAKDLAPPPRR